MLTVSMFLPPAKEVWGKVMFLHLCVILFTGGGRSVQPPCRQTWGGWTDPTVQTPLDADPPVQTPLPGCIQRERSTSGRYASYFNSYLFKIFIANFKLVISVQCYVKVKRPPGHRDFLQPGGQPRNSAVSCFA